MSTSVVESIVATLVDTLNAVGRPSLVPLVERDRWVDIELDQLPVITLSGWEDDAESNQSSDRVVDRRVLSLHFEIYASGLPERPSDGVSGGLGESTLPAIPPSQAADVLWQWLVKQCGVVTSTHPLWNYGVSRVLSEKRLLVVAKENVVRGLVVLTVHYQNLVNDATRVK